MKNRMIKKIKRTVAAALMMSLLTVQLTPAARLSEEAMYEEQLEDLECLESEAVVGAAGVDDETDAVNGDSVETPESIDKKTIAGDAENVFSMPTEMHISDAYYAMANVTYSISTNEIKTGETRYVRFVMPEDGILKFNMNGSDSKSASASRYVSAYVRLKDLKGNYQCMVHRQKIIEKADSYTSPEWGLKKGSQLLLKVVNSKASKPYTFRFNVTPSQEWELECNDDAENANTVSVNVPYGGNFHYNDSYDWFTAKATDNGRMCVRVAIDSDNDYGKSLKYWHIKVYVNDRVRVYRKTVKLKVLSKVFESPSFLVEKGDKIDFYIEEGNAPVGVNYKVTLSTDIQEYTVVKGQRIKLSELTSGGSNYYISKVYKKNASVNKKGIFKAKKPELAVVSYSKNGVKREMVFNIETPVLDSASVNCLREKGDTISYSDLVHDIVSEPFKYEIKKTKVATVDEYGKITAHSGGTVNLIAWYGTPQYPKSYSFKLKVPCTTLKKNFVKVKEEKSKKVSIKNIYKKKVEISPLDATVVKGTLYLDKKENSGKILFEGLKAGSTDVYIKVDGVDYICKVEVLMNPKAQQTTAP